MWIFGSFLSIESVMVYNHLIFCQLLLLLHLIFPSIRVFANESVLLIRWPKYWSFNFSISLMNIQDWFPLGLTGMISLQSKGISRVFTSMAVWKHQFLYTQPSLWSGSHIHTWLLEKTIALTRQAFVTVFLTLKPWSIPLYFSLFSSIWCSGALFLFDMMHFKHLKAIFVRFLFKFLVS